MSIFDRFFREKRTSEDRRDDAERRVAKGPVSRDRRDGTDRRTGGERRHQIHAIEYTTTGSVTRLEEWLDANCKATWTIVLVDIDDAFSRKKVRIMFESEEDKQGFVASLKKKD